MEGQAGRLERQFAMLQNAPHAAFEILDHVLVLHPQHPPRQQVVPVSHEVEVGAVVAGDVVETIGEFLVGRAEQLLEIAEAAGHRLAPDVDDLRSGQDQVDQADVPEIVRRLVDEDRPAQPAIGAGFVQEALAEQPGVRGGHVQQGLRAQRQAAGRIAAAELAGVSVDLGQLLRALDTGMGGQDLLDQGRARPRQADDENRRRIACAPARPRGEDLGGERLLQSHGAGFRGVGAIAAGGAPQRVAALVAPP